MIAVVAVVVAASTPFVGSPNAMTANPIAIERYGERGAHTSTPDLRRTLRRLAAEREGAPADHEHADDHEERHGAAPTLQRGGIGHLRLQVGDLGLEDADEQPAGERERERAEAANESGRHAGDDEQREVGDAQARHVDDQDCGDDGETGPEPPVRGGDAVGRDAEQSPVLVDSRPPRSSPARSGSCGKRW